MKTVKVPRGFYTFRHFRPVMVADTTHIGDREGLCEMTQVCEAHYPASSCRCGKYAVHWWL